MNFHKTVISSVVGAALASAAPSVFSNDLNGAQTYKSFDDAQVTHQQKKITDAPTLSGMSNQYDAQLGKTTFPPLCLAMCL